jgi:hypothetical protein
MDSHSFEAFRKGVEANASVEEAKELIGFAKGAMERRLKAWNRIEALQKELEEAEMVDECDEYTEDYVSAQAEVDLTEQILEMIEKFEKK